MLPTADGDASATRRFRAGDIHEKISSRLRVLGHPRVNALGEQAESGAHLVGLRRDTLNAEEREGALVRSQSHDAVVEGPAILDPGRRWFGSPPHGPIAVGGRPYDIGQHAPMAPGHLWHRSDADPADVRDFRRAR